MTIPYNVTLNGVNEHLKEFFHYHKIDNNHLYLPINATHGTKYITPKYLFKLSQITHSTLYVTHPELQEVVNYFKEMVKLMTELNLPVIWLTPAASWLTNKTKIC